MKARFRTRGVKRRFASAASSLTLDGALNDLCSDGRGASGGDRNGQFQANGKSRQSVVVVLYENDRETRVVPHRRLVFILFFFLFFFAAMDWRSAKPDDVFLIEIASVVEVTTTPHEGFRDRIEKIRRRDRMQSFTVGHRVGA